LPQAWEERRDRGLVLAELGYYAQAVDDLSAYLEHRPGADDHAALAARVSALRDVGWPRLH
jgi:regulator of sirC expression with transglutaminase-like and TPR domain